MPKFLFLAAFVAAAVLIPPVLQAQSLADVARAEEARRKAVKDPPAKVYTNEDLKPGVNSPAPPAAPASTAGASTGKPTPPGAAADAKAAEAKAAEAKKGEAPAPAKDEKYWRDRITAARTSLQRNRAFVDALQSQINGLYTEFVNMDDPAKRAVIEKKRLEAIAEQERLKAEIEMQTKEITAIEDEARRAGAPSGWLR